MNKMKEYVVVGMAQVVIHTKIKANSKEEALKLASENIPHLQNYAGNGETNFSVGIDNGFTMPDDDNCIHWDDAWVG